MSDEELIFVCQNILGWEKKILLLRKENFFLLKGAFYWVTPVKRIKNITRNIKPEGIALSPRQEFDN
jgi:hypothetical protein